MLLKYKAIPIIGPDTELEDSMERERIYEIPEKGGIVARCVRDDTDYRIIHGPMDHTLYSDVLVMYLGFKEDRRYERMKENVVSAIGKRT